MSADIARRGRQIANPSRYVPSYDFSDFQETQPSTPLPGVQVDAQLNDISESTTELRDAILDIRRSDGALVNEIVTEDSLAPGLLAALSSETGATAAAASAVAAAASASAAAVSANTVAATQATLAASGGVSDWGYVYDAPSVFSDWGTIP